MAVTLSEARLAIFLTGVTGGLVDTDVLTVVNHDELRAAVRKELESSSLRDHMDLLNSKNQLNNACNVAADFGHAQGFEYQKIYAMLTIFFFHAEDILEHQPDTIHNLQLRLATGTPLGDPPLTLDATVYPQASNFPEWLRFKTGLSPMYALLALARNSDVRCEPTGSLAKYIQTLPDVIIFTNIVNDVVSFYKEYSAGEKGNYLDMRAEKDGIEVIRAQRVLADEGITVYKRIVATLADEPEYRANFEAYARGSTHFHTSSPRYRLRELFPKPGQS
ncbi:isoprenoid synthase domain-containing protein [Xylariaceae sp. FL0255]|nr:isoprenoid synthase domain-containing protein [Xylariaceae sp. FL0255]